LQVSGAKTSYVIEDLKASTNYTVRVTAVNGQGLSEPVEVSHVNREPTHAERFAVKNLQQGIGYEFKVEAYNEDGVRSTSEVITIPLLIPVLDLPRITPSIPRITVTGPDSVTIDWTTPEYEPSPSFTVAYKSESSDIWEEVHCDTNFCKIDGLKEEVSYVFKVAIRNEHGVGNFSETSRPVKILPSSPPVVLKSIRDVTVSRKDQLRLECRFSGHPTPEHVWYKDGAEIIPKDSNTEVS
ncbi:fibronectin type III domain protein, partial [Oesophagostomum dentatum]